MADNEFLGKHEKRIAVLIDADNVSFSLIENIIEEATKYGKITIKRVYGDWSTPKLSGWKEVLNSYSLRPIQKFEYTKGKNSTDSALIIDAMDILYAKAIQGFCIVSSDSDYTGLVQRIREDGLFVLGIGKQSTTPTALTKACDIFTFTENLQFNDKGIESTSPEKTNSKKETISTVSKELLSNLKILVSRAYDIGVHEDGTLLLTQLSETIKKLDPTFDKRTYKCTSMGDIFRNFLQNDYELSGPPHAKNVKRKLHIVTAKGVASVSTKSP